MRGALTKENTNSGVEANTEQQVMEIEPTQIGECAIPVVVVQGENVVQAEERRESMKVNLEHETKTESATDVDTEVEIEDKISEVVWETFEKEMAWMLEDEVGIKPIKERVSSGGEEVCIVETERRQKEQWFYGRSEDGRYPFMRDLNCVGTRSRVLWQS